MYYWKCDKCGLVVEQDGNGRYPKSPDIVYDRVRDPAQRSSIFATLCLECYKKFTQMEASVYGDAFDKATQKFFGKSIYKKVVGG